MSTVVIEFRNDDGGYDDWLLANPDGFVVNSRAVLDPNYLILHRARCGTISRAKDTTTFTAGAYVKFVSVDRQSLIDWGKARAKGLSKPCSLCKPGAIA